MAVEAQEGEELINIKCDQQCRCRGQEAERHHSERVVVAEMEDEALSKSGSQALFNKVAEGSHLSLVPMVSSNSLSLSAS
jgi:hypothetical protein